MIDPYIENKFKFGLKTTPEQLQRFWDNLMDDPAEAELTAPSLLSRTEVLYGYSSLAASYPKIYEGYLLPVLAPYTINLQAEEGIMVDGQFSLLQDAETGNVTRKVREAKITGLTARISGLRYNEDMAERLGMSLDEYTTGEPGNYAFWLSSLSFRIVDEAVGQNAGVERCAVHAPSIETIETVMSSTSPSWP